MEVFPSTGGVQVFVNERNEVAITQDDVFGGESSIVTIPLVHVDLFIKAVREAQRNAMEG